MQQARARGQLRVFVLGIALTALSLNATVLTVAVINSVVFDSLFREPIHVNAKNELVVHMGEGTEGRGLALQS